MANEINRITLKKIKSVETSDGYFYSATVYIDGKKAGEVENGGYGGPDEYSSMELEATLSAIAATMPPYKSEFDGKENQHNAETMIGQLIDKHFMEKRLKTILKNRFVFSRKENGRIEIRTTKTFPPATLVRYMGQEDAEGKLKRQFNADVVLNFLPFEKAIDVYMSAAQ